MLKSAVIAAILLAAPCAQAEDAADDLPALLNKYRCPVVDRLERAHDFGDPAEERDRYLILALPDISYAYVQCVFHNTNTKILCEAASGAYYDTPRTVRLPAAAIAALGRLGFSTDDSTENFKLDFDVATPPDYIGIADLMLTALHVGYGADASTKITFEAPYARREPASCAPVG